MNQEALIALIAKKVLEQVSESSAAEQVSSSNQVPVLVIGETDRSVLAEMLGSGFKLSFFSDSGDLCADQYQHIVLAELSNKFLSDMAIGLERGADGCVIVDSLMKGKTIYVLEEGIVYRRYKNTAKPAFYQLFKNKEQKLVEYGMEVVSVRRLQATLMGESLQDKRNHVPETETPAPVITQNKEKNKALIVDKRVISEGDLRRGFDQGYKRIVVQSRALITPLARDYIRTKNLHIDRVE